MRRRRESLCCIPRSRGAQHNRSRTQSNTRPRFLRQLSVWSVDNSLYADIKTIELIDMAFPLILENSLILACARTDPDVQCIEDLVRGRVDWQAILEKVEKWGLTPLVYTNIRQVIESGHVPKPVAEHLRHLYHRDMIHGVARRELLRATLAQFSEAGVPVIVLKGSALAALVYPSPGLRTI